MQVKFKILLFLIPILMSCNSELGEVVSSEQLNVFYLEPVEKSQAKQILNFWERHQFIDTVVQNLQLTENENSFVLKLIPVDTNFLAEIPFDVQLELFKLDSLLNSEIDLGKPMKLVLSDASFQREKEL